MNKTDKPKYWFKRRRYGYGWTPSTWQGWTVIAAFLFVVIGSASLLIAAYEGVYVRQLVWIYLNVFLVIVVGFIMAFTKKAPSPKWRWGKKPDDNHHEDF